MSSKFLTEAEKAAMSWGVVPFKAEGSGSLKLISLSEDEDWDAGPVKTQKEPVKPPAAEKSWDDEDKEEAKPAPAPTVQQQVRACGIDQVAKCLQPKQAAKPAAKGSGKASAKPKAAAAPAAPLSAEEEKQRRQDEVVKSDFANLKDIFSGVVDEKDTETEKKLTTFVPITEADFEEFGRMLNERIQASKVSSLLC